MVAPVRYLLDTNIVLLSTRAGNLVSAKIEQQFVGQSLRPTICEVSLGELWAFAQSASWGKERRDLLSKIIDRMVVLPISDERIHRHWAELYSYSKSQGLPIFNDHNDAWIAATAKIAGHMLLTTDKKGFAPLMGSTWVDVVVLDPHTGLPA